MRVAAWFIAGVMWLALGLAPATAASLPDLPDTAMAEPWSPAPGLLPARPGAGLAAAETAPVVLARCGPRCRAARRAYRRHKRRHYWRPYRPRPGYHYYRKRRRDAAAAAVIGGVIGLGIGAAIANSQPRYYDDDFAPQFADPGR